MLIRIPNFMFLDPRNKDRTTLVLLGEDRRIIAINGKHQVTLYGPLQNNHRYEIYFRKDDGIVRISSVAYDEVGTVISIGGYSVQSSTARSREASHPNG